MKTAIILVTLFLILIISIGCVSTDEKIDAPTGIEIETSTFEYIEGAQGFVVKPTTDGNYPGLILIHEWWGLNDNIKESAKQFAEQGYVVLAVDLYEGEVTTDPTVARYCACRCGNRKLK